MEHSEWIDLIAKEFDVSKSYAKKMYHAMIRIYMTQCRIV